MSSKVNNKTLLYVFLGLIVLFGAVKLYQKKFTENTLKTSFIEVDTAKVTKILLYPESEGRTEIKFFKEGKTWKISKGNLIAEPDANAVNELLNMFSNIKIQRLASRDKAKWKEFNLTDSTATRVEIYEGKKQKLDLMIGKFTYQQTRNPYGDMYGQGGIIGTTYVRETGENDIYGVEGFLSFAVNRQFNTFRNSMLARFTASEVNKVTFRYPGDSSFVLTLADKNWMIGNEKVDSTQVANYLNSLSSKRASSYDDSFKPAMGPQCQIIVEGKNMPAVNIDAYVRGNNDFVISSNQNSKSFFSSNYGGLYSEIFKNRKDFMVSKKK